MVTLGVNIDHVATLRQARGTSYPSVVEAGLVVQRAGADQVTVHLREDRRHIQDADVRALKELLQVPLNLEMALTTEMLQFALDVCPSVVTVVPEKRQERTTEGGLNLHLDPEQTRIRIRMLSEHGVMCSAFVEPELDAVKMSAKLGFHTVEFHTGQFVADRNGHFPMQELERLAQSARLAAKLGLRVAAGHGLTLRSAPLVAAIEHVAELNIGHALISDAVFDGLANSVKMYKNEIGHIGN